MKQKESLTAKKRMKSTDLEMLSDQINHRERQGAGMGYFALFAFLLVLFFVGCGKASRSDSNQQLTGAGATFPAPLYQRWFAEYNRLYPSVQVNYQGVGSGAGVRQFTQGTIDFGASDTAMTDEEIAEAQGNVVLLPMTAGSIVLIYHLPELSHPLKLSREVYSQIFLGKITHWNDPLIASCNPDITLPDLPIVVVYRADSSGTTYVFSKHLSAISPAWKEEMGTSKSVPWKTGLGAKGNNGVVTQVKSSLGSIGYVEFGYASENKMAIAELENHSGHYVAPTVESGMQALSEVQLSENMVGWVSDPSGDQAYPIVTFTWILAHKKYADPEKDKAIKNLLLWSLKEGQAISSTLGYLPLPPEVAERAQSVIKKVE